MKIILNLWNDITYLKIKGISKHSCYCVVEIRAWILEVACFYTHCEFLHSFTSDCLNRAEPIVWDMKCIMMLSWDHVMQESISGKFI